MTTLEICLLAIAVVLAVLLLSAWHVMNSRCRCCCCQDCKLRYEEFEEADQFTRTVCHTSTEYDEQGRIIECETTTVSSGGDQA